MTFIRSALIATILGTMVGCDYFWPSKYAAEVGVYHGEEIKWELWGDFGSLEECRNAALARYNFYFAQKRAQSWSCLLKNGKGGYASRQR